MVAVTLGYGAGYNYQLVVQGAVRQTHRQHERCVSPVTTLTVDVCPTLLHQCHYDGRVTVL